MALITVERWVEFSKVLGISDETSSTYGTLFVNNGMSKMSLEALTREDLQTLGINQLGHVTAILGRCYTLVTRLKLALEARDSSKWQQTRQFIQDW